MNILYVDRDNPECSICWEGFSKDVIAKLEDPNNTKQTIEKIRKLACNHVFHEDCVKDWMDLGNTACPMCREKINESSSDPMFLIAEQIVKLFVAYCYS